MNFTPYIDAAFILSESDHLSTSDLRKYTAMFEDTTSPITNRYVEKLYDSVIKKGHVDFDKIPDSMGRITQYSGYKSIQDTLNTIKELATAQKADKVLALVDVITRAIDNMIKLTDVYEKGFRMKCDYVELEYCTYVYTIIQATSALLYTFVDYIKRPGSEKIDITIKNNERNANLFYFQQLKKFNSVCNDMNYRAFLEGTINKGREQFIGTDTAIGLAVVTAVALAIVPLTRTLIYHFYNAKSKVSDFLAQQAYFLELNKANVQLNTEFDAQKKEKILRKQEILKNNLMKLSDKLRVVNKNAESVANRELKTDNSLMTVDRIKREVNSEPLVLM